MTNLSESSLNNGFIVGGNTYFTQNIPGTYWFDNVSNDKGWTIDFNLKVADIKNSESVLSETINNGVGIYVNDGTKKEIIEILTQEIIFKKAGEKVVFDTTGENDYRIIGKGDNLKLFVKSSSSSAIDPYILLKEIKLNSLADNSGNSKNSHIAIDIDGKIHVVWEDDGNGIGQIFYSYFYNNIWSEAEIIDKNDIGKKNPNILVNNLGIVFISYEANISNYSSIGFIYKNELGWSNPYYIGVSDGDSKSPKMSFDSQYNIIVVWEDWRFNYSEIYLSKFIYSLQKWEDEIRITETNYGCFNPSVSSYFDDIFIVWEQKENIEDSSIYISKGNSNTLVFIDGTKISESGVDCNYPNILVNVSGKVVVVWHRKDNGKYKIYGKGLSVLLDTIVEEEEITNDITSNGGCKYPSLSEQELTGNIYIVWQDYNENYQEFSNGESDEYSEGVLFQTEPPTNNIIKICYFNNLYNLFYSGSNGYIDFTLSFNENRLINSICSPSFFSGDIPICYEFYKGENSGYLLPDNLFSKIGCAIYDISNSYETYLVSNNEATDDIYNPYLDRDFCLSSMFSKKEIRFGDFSRTKGVHYIFKNFRYYLNDAVNPFYIVDISAANYSFLDSINAHDAVINNYGDVWFVGSCGMMYFIYNGSQIILVGDNEDIDADISGNIKTIGFDKYNKMFVSNQNKIIYSSNHVSDFSELLIGGSSVQGVDVLTFDKNNKLILGINNIGATVVRSIKIIDLTTLLIEESFSVAGDITSIRVDDNNITWVGTTNGLYRIFNKQILRFSTANGLVSNYVNDITVRNTAIRYLATPRGIVKMVGSSFDNIITSENSNIWNNNVKSVLWMNPNILWAGTMSKLNQIIVDDVNEEYSTVIYEPDKYNVIKSDDFRTYYILTGDNQEILDNDVIEVYINGNIINHGYILGKDNINNRRVIRFESDLNSSDIVEVIVRKDLEIIGTFEQSDEEVSILGRNLIRIKDIIVKNENEKDYIYVSTIGDENQIKVNDTNIFLPFDKVHLDSTPPDGTINIIDNSQIDRTTIKVNVTANDDFDGIVGSGIDKMVVSNYPNFTTDGTTIQSPVDFSQEYTHDLGINLDNIISSPIEDGNGNGCVFIAGENQIFYYTSLSAIVYKYNIITNEWDNIFLYGEDFYVDFVTKYNNQLIVSVGSKTSYSKIYIYQYIYVDGIFNSFSFLGEHSFTESRAFSYVEKDGIMYIGTGIGDGDGSISGIGLHGGKIYSYNGSTISEVVRNVDENVYSLTSVDVGNNILAATGESGFVFEIDIVNQTAFPIHNDSESLSSIQFINYNSSPLVFVGGSNNGIIRRSQIGSNSFDISFRTVSSKISKIKKFTITENAITAEFIYAAVGNFVYYLSESGTWVWKYTHSENINDIEINSLTNEMYVISNNYITTISSSLEEKSIYLKLIDRAGNESVLYDNSGAIKSNFTDSISISDLIGFVNENKIFELDEFGNIVFNLKGNGSFYSADRIDEEKGIYESEIFDGTSFLVKWDTLSWQATEIDNTEVLIYVRTSSSKNDIISEDWIGPYYNSQASGVNIGNLSGRFFQFKIELISKTKDVSPTFHRATIKCITSEAIHFFTTNFVLNNRVKKGILTSQKIVPVSADVVFGINTTNSIDWNDYQIVDENRLFNINQIGENFRVGIKLLSPSRHVVTSSVFDEYGPNGESLFVNTVDFIFLNNTGEERDFSFRISLYDYESMSSEVYTVSSYNKIEGFNIDGEEISTGGYSIADGESVDVLFSIPGSANILCNTYYSIKIEAIYNDGENDVDILISDSNVFIAGCSSSFVDYIDFNFTSSGAGDYHFRIKFYENPERTNEFLTIFSGNNISGWEADSLSIPEEGVSVSAGNSINVIYAPELESFEANTNYYLTIDAWDGTNFILLSNSYTFQARDVSTLIYCGEYYDVPIVKNFGVMLELEDNEFVNLNIV